MYGEINKYLVDKYYSGARASELDAVKTKAVYVGYGLLSSFNEFLSENAIIGNVAALYDENTESADGMACFSCKQKIVLKSEGLHADENALACVREALRSDIKVIAAVGGGTIHDIARYIAKERGLTLISCPTAASVDGFCSLVAAMTLGGVKVTVPCVAPKIVISDLTVIENAPKRLALSGIGDMLGKCIALADWQIANVLTGEAFSNTIMKISSDAFNDVYRMTESISGEKYYSTLMEGLLLSGITMQLCGSSRPASGAEHHIAHLQEICEPSSEYYSNALHGERVGVSTLLAIEKYKRYAKIEDIESRIKDFSPIDYEKLRGVLSDNVIGLLKKENENDCLLGVDKNVLRNRWQTVREIIGLIPGLTEMTELFEKLGVKKSLADIGIAETAADKLFELSPTIRNRLTLARINRLINF